MKRDLPEKYVASGVFIGNIIISGLSIASLSMVLVAVWLATMSP